jgi:hypothetical protein
MALLGFSMSFVVEYDMCGHLKWTWVTLALVWVQGVWVVVPPLGPLLQGSLLDFFEPDVQSRGCEST